jgi:hypothetical protein
MHSLNLMKINLGRLFRGASIALVAMGALLAATNAVAACGDPSGLKSGAALKLPFLMQPGGEAGSTHRPNAPDGNDSIGGLWSVNYTTGGQLLYQSFDQWHSDGTELENPNLAPATGPLCVGVWKQIGPHTFRLHHVGWTFDINGNSLGSFSLNETNGVAVNGRTYQGRFDLRFYDVDGNLVQEVTGTQKAARITVD